MVPAKIFRPEYGAVLASFPGPLHGDWGWGLVRCVTIVTAKGIGRIYNTEHTQNFARFWWTPPAEPPPLVNPPTRKSHGKHWLCQSMFYFLNIDCARSYNNAWVLGLFTCHEDSNCFWFSSGLAGEHRDNEYHLVGLVSTVWLRTDSLKGGAQLLLQPTPQYGNVFHWNMSKKNLLQGTLN